MAGVDDIAFLVVCLASLVCGLGKIKRQRTPIAIFAAFDRGIGHGVAARGGNLLDKVLDRIAVCVLDGQGGRRDDTFAVARERVHIVDLNKAAIFKLVEFERSAAHVGDAVHALDNLAERQLALEHVGESDARGRAIAAVRIRKADDRLRSIIVEADVAVVFLDDFIIVGIALRVRDGEAGNRGLIGVASDRRRFERLGRVRRIKGIRIRRLIDVKLEFGIRDLIVHVYRVFRRLGCILRQFLGDRQRASLVVTIVLNSIFAGKAPGLALLDFRRKRGAGLIVGGSLALRNAIEAHGQRNHAVAIALGGERIDFPTLDGITTSVDGRDGEFNVRKFGVGFAIDLFDLQTAAQRDDVDERQRSVRGQLDLLVSIRAREFIGTLRMSGLLHVVRAGRECDRSAAGVFDRKLRDRFAAGIAIVPGSFRVNIKFRAARIMEGVELVVVRRFSVCADLDLLLDGERDAVLGDIIGSIRLSGVALLALATELIRQRNVVFDEQVGILPAHRIGQFKSLAVIGGRNGIGRIRGNLGRVGGVPRIERDRFVIRNGNGRAALRERHGLAVPGDGDVGGLIRNAIVRDHRQLVGDGEACKLQRAGPVVGILAAGNGFSGQFAGVDRPGKDEVVIRVLCGHAIVSIQLFDRPRMAFGLVGDAGRVRARIGKRCARGLRLDVHRGAA